MRAAIELAGLAALAALGLALAGADAVASLAAGAATTVYAALVGAAIARADALDRPLGWANRATILRGFLGATLVGSLAGTLEATAVAGIAIIALALDALDGWLARRLGAASALGARLDMETDAALMLVLCLVLVAQDRAGPWLLAVGAARYAFIAAGAVVASLRRALPPSRRRRLAAATVMIGLAIAIVPAVPADAARATAAAITLVTIASFAVDVVWLLRRGARG